MKPLTRRLGYRRLVLGEGFWLIRPRQLFCFSALAAGLVLLAVTGLALGSSVIAPRELAEIMVRGGASDPFHIFVLTELRLPRILLALLVGAMLGMAGAVMQEIARNGLADPGLIGVNEGASVTILALALLYPVLDAGWRPMAGLAGGLAVAGVVVSLARSTSGLRFVLIGTGVGWFLSSAISLFLTMGRITDVENALVWLSGSLHAASWRDLAIAAPWALAGGSLLALTSRAGDAFALGSVAVGLGVRLRQTVALRLFGAVLLSAASTSVVGSLGFVGLIAPHFARLVIGASQLPLLIGSALGGAMLVLGADMAGRTLFAPVQLPAGVMMAIIGVPFFLFILWLRRNEL